MARKKLTKVGDTEKKTRWNKKGTRKYELEYKLTEVRKKPKRTSKAKDEKTAIQKLKKIVKRDKSAKRAAKSKSRTPPEASKTGSAKRKKSG